MYNIYHRIRQGVHMGGLYTLDRVTCTNTTLKNWFETHDIHKTLQDYDSSAPAVDTGM